MSENPYLRDEGGSPPKKASKPFFHQTLSDALDEMFARAERKLAQERRGERGKPVMHAPSKEDELREGKATKRRVQDQRLFPGRDRDFDIIRPSLPIKVYEHLTGKFPGKRDG